MPNPTTWLCTFRVSCDMPNTMTPWEMENAVAQALARQLPTLGFQGNCIVTLMATAGGVSVLDADPASHMGVLGGDGSTPIAPATDV